MGFFILETKREEVRRRRDNEHCDIEEIKKEEKRINSNIQILPPVSNLLLVRPAGFSKRLRI